MRRIILGGLGALVMTMLTVDVRADGGHGSAAMSPAPAVSAMVTCRGGFEVWLQSLIGADGRIVLRWRYTGTRCA
jgi:hypothetical protein